MKTIDQQVNDILNTPRAIIAQDSAGYDYCKRCGDITKAVWRRRISIFALIVLVGTLPIIGVIVAYCFAVNIGLGIGSLVAVYAGLHWERTKACSKCHKYYDKWFDNFYSN